ncbi:hypothetical protein AG1IA_10441 [Rhizoctonia solani AG-1 IA]|uniref:Uncharacterized protein n=1 Tax=Thanatephorus cucumeris (strain AG1-IA) TaxID=983506 RepID=L8WGJ9_THACA|nr:hypothetical protein AG1IA_10441 [Rhizoctonia solani AG-1 IA]
MKQTTIPIAGVCHECASSAIYPCCIETSAFCRHGTTTRGSDIAIDKSSTDTFSEDFTAMLLAYHTQSEACSNGLANTSWVNRFELLE